MPWALALLLSTCAGPAAKERPAAEGGSPGRIVILGGRLGRGAGLPFGLAEAVRAALQGRVEVVDATSPGLPFAPDRLAAAACRRAAAAAPAVVLAPDFLWELVRGGGDENTRLLRFEMGLRLLGRLPGRLFVGDLPARDLPAALRRVLEARLAEWAREDPRRHLLPLAAWLTEMEAGRPLRVWEGSFRLPPGEALRDRGTRPAPAAVLGLALLCLESVAQAVPDLTADRPLTRVTDLEAALAVLAPPALRPRPAAELIRRLEGNLVEIPPGEVPLGGEVRRVAAFRLGRHEVTQELWVAVMTGWRKEVGLTVDPRTGAVQPVEVTNPSVWTGRGDLPVENVSYRDVLAFLARLNALAGLTGRPDRYRLPTEAEWLRACRAGETRSWTAATAARTEPVGQLPPNPLGLYDLGGNVAEWCTPATGGRPVVRGGSVLTPAGGCGYRRLLPPDAAEKALGFRLARSRL